MKILFGVSGGIAAYKAPEVLRAFIKDGNEVEVVLTEAAEQLVSPLALATLAKKHVWRQRDFLSPEMGWKIPHISLSKWADVVVVAPCTAETLSNLATGRAAPLLAAAVLAAKGGKKPVVLFTAMNSAMLDSPATVENIKILEARGFRVIDPDSGMLACGDEGRGRMPDAGVILEETKRAFTLSKNEKTLSGKKILITAGATIEHIDPVRFISNSSSGKMGAALAKTAWRRGADVRLVLGANSIPPVHGVETINVASADDMLKAVTDNFEWADIVVKAAAVSDYKPSTCSDEKIKRDGTASMSLELVQNPDIAAEVGKRKRPGQILVGFALETNDMLANARAKLEKKNLDIIVANHASAIGAENSSATLVRRDGDTKELCGSKEEIANGIWDAIC